MAANRLLYLALLLGCGIFYLAYGQWLAWFLLVTVAVLPWFSLLLSLPAMRRFRVCPAGQEILEMGDRGEFWLLGSCRWPLPTFRGQLRFRRCLDDQTFPYQEDMSPVTAHCGGIAVTARRVRICDYLGLFSVPVRSGEDLILLIRPKPVPAALPDDLRSHLHTLRGSGPAENQEPQPYRPGDGIRRIHWKLTAKTGSLILRQPSDPVTEQILLTLHLRGTAEELDRKFGRLLWLGQYLLQRAIPFELRALTGRGLLTFSVRDECALQKAIDSLLCCPIARESDWEDLTDSAPWHCRIGGAPDDA